MKRTLLMLLAGFFLCGINAELHSAIKDTTRVDWGGVSNRLCLEELVWCWLTEVSTTDSTTFDTFVSERNGTIFDWRGYIENPSGEFGVVLCVIEVPDAVDLANEATAYKNSCLTKNAGPVFVEAEPQWPNDDKYNVAGHKQWYLEDIDDIAGSINWLPVAEEMEQRGREDIVIGVIDSGISVYENEEHEYDEDDLSHGDMMNHEFLELENDRFIVGEDFDINGNGDGQLDNLNSHGTMVISVLAAVDHETARGEDGAAQNFGMIGVNTKSQIISNSLGLRNFVAVTTNIIHAILYSWLIQECDIVNISYGHGPNSEIYEEVFNLMEEEQDNYKLPLIVISGGNLPTPYMVQCPARYAFYGDPNFDPYHPRGYKNVMSVGGCKINATSDPGSFNKNHHQISCVGPSDNLTVALSRDEEEDPWDRFFDNNDGTSFASPIVAGVASLVMSEALDNGQELSAWEVRRIIEKTSRDVNFGEEIAVPGPDIDVSLFDVQMGYGIVDCEAAVTNRDLQKWELEPEEWYWISSRIDPVYTDPRRVLEDLTFQDDIYDNRLWCILSNEEDNKFYDPEDDLWGEEPWGENPEWEWDFRIGYVLGLHEDAEDNEELLICGIARDIDEEIPVEEDWNFVAYFPDWEDDAEDVLTSIATWGDPESDLILAKGQNGDFYSPEYSFSNLTMKPGEGYKMDMDTNATLTYPATQPCSINNDEHREPTQPVHFQYLFRTGDFLPILISTIRVENREVETSDEIGVFINDTMCVGAGVIGDQFPIGFAAWRDNLRTNRIEGFSDFRNLTFRYWDNSEDEEIGHDGIRVAFTDAIEEPSLWVMDLDFTGNVKEPVEPKEFGLVSVYPNPFNSQTTVRYSITDAAEIQINVLDINGRQITTLVNGFSNSGQYRIMFDASSLASGSYIIELAVSESRFTKRVELVK